MKLHQTGTNFWVTSIPRRWCESLTASFLSTTEIVLQMRRISWLFSTSTHIYNTWESSAKTITQVIFSTNPQCVLIMYISLTSNMRHPSRKTNNVIKNVSADLQINVLQNSHSINRLREVCNVVGNAGRLKRWGRRTHTQHMNTL